MSNRNKLLITTGLVSAVGIAGIAIAFGAFESSGNGEPAANPEAVPKDRLVAQAGDGKCNPCAAKKCNPCAAAKCNPCAAKKCNPCAAAKCNPCAAKKCNPCAAAKCNPCAAKKCNPCAAAKCNPCAAKKCNPCAAAKCNPCAAKKCNPCNPCAGANPCNPCAGANPCNPCAGANPCNPCAPQGGRELSDTEAATVYNLLLKDADPYLSDGSGIAADYRNWDGYNTVPYVSATHGGRYVNNYANSAAANYGKFESFGEMPVGSVLAKDSFLVDASGETTLGPLFLMRKMEAGFRPDFGDWEYTLIMPGGDVYGVTNGTGSGNVEFCGSCHMAVPGQDHMFFIPVEYRKK